MPPLMHFAIACTSTDVDDGLWDTLEEKITALTQARNEQSQLAARHQTELGHMQNQLKQKDTRIAQLESDLAELNARQDLLNDEITRAEIQIDLIKDVLLREPGL